MSNINEKHVNTEVIEAFAIDEIKRMKFSVRKIDESNTEKSPDLYVDDGKNTYLIELKSKISDSQLLQNTEQPLIQNKITEISTELHFKNSISKRIKEATKQLSNYKEKPAYFKLIWLHAIETQHNQSEKIYEQFKRTLYGIEMICNLNDNIKPCYYFSPSELYFCRNVIDGAIISTDKKGMLCLNTYSSKYKELKKSHLCKKFGNGVCDPIAKEIKGIVYIADCDIDRKDEVEVLTYIRNKYGEKRLTKMISYDYSSWCLL